MGRGVDECDVIALGGLGDSRFLIRGMWRRQIPDVVYLIRAMRSYGVSAICTVVIPWRLALVIDSLHRRNLCSRIGYRTALVATAKTLSAITYASTRCSRTSAWWIHSTYQLIAGAILGGVLAVLRCTPEKSKASYGRRMVSRKQGRSMCHSRIGSEDETANRFFGENCSE